MKRAYVDLDQVASLDNLAHAFWRASRTNPCSSQVSQWSKHLESELASLRASVLSGKMKLGCFQVFSIRDPKPRIIRAPCFRERVLHHAVMAYVGPILDRSLVADTYACRSEKGVHVAAKRVQHHLRRYSWCVRIDIRGYFAKINHHILKSLLLRRIKGQGVLRLLSAIIDAHHDTPDYGLPIGALTSQHFANFYLSSLDRYLLEDIKAQGMVRYMDDIVWWCNNREQAGDSLPVVSEFLKRQLQLQIKPQWHIGPSTEGLRFCGFKICPGTMLLSPRRRRRYAQARRRWETAFALGVIDARTLQAGYASALAITAHADAKGFLRQQLCRAPTRIEC